MKRRIAVIGALVSFLPIGQPLLMGISAVITSSAVMIALPESVKGSDLSDYDWDLYMYLYDRGVKKCQEGDHYGCISVFDKVMEVYPGYSLAYFWRGDAKENIGDYYGALSDYNILIQLDPFVLNYLIRGNVKRMLGDREGACADVRKAESLPSYDAYKTSDPGQWLTNYC